jgi:hypothetical protein
MDMGDAGAYVRPSYDGWADFRQGIEALNHFFRDEMRGPDAGGNCLNDYGYFHDSREFRLGLGSPWNRSGSFGVLDTNQNSDRPGALMPGDDGEIKMILGRLIATMESIEKSNTQEREEVRERNRKFEEDGKERTAKLDALLSDLRTMDNRFSRQISEVKHTYANRIQEVSGRIEIVDLHIKNLQIRSVDSADQISKLSAQITKLTENQADTTREIARIKDDTKELRPSITTMVGNWQKVTAIAAFASGLAVVMGWIIHEWSNILAIIGVGGVPK